MIYKLSQPSKWHKIPGLLGKISPVPARNPGIEFAPDFRQWIADMYHCCGQWGTKYTVPDFRYDMRNWIAEGIEVPAFVPVSKAVRYWNELSDLYLN